MTDLPDLGAFSDGLSYADYRADWDRQVQDAPSSGADASARRLHHYLRYNWKRQAHVHDVYAPSETLRSALDAVEAPQAWRVLTEPWCGDSAFLLPVIAEAAALSDQVSLRILLRDENLDLMDQYLTDGSRSIPKLVAFSGAGEELFTWGPRPAPAAQRFAALQDEYEDKSALIGTFLEHYEDGGWQAADAELADQLWSVAGMSSSIAEA
jgi:hypothetical protein